jgi:hypothetical protein
MEDFIERNMSIMITEKNNIDKNISNNNLTNIQYIYLLVCNIDNLENKIIFFEKPILNEFIEKHKIDNFKIEIFTNSNNGKFIYEFNNNFIL